VVPIEAELADLFIDADLRLVADVAHRARERARSEQRPLRAAQHFDARHVEQIDVGREERERDHRFVEVDADLLLHSGLVAHDLAGGDAAHGDLTLPRPEVLHREAGDVRGDVFDVLGAAVAQLRFGRRGDGHRHVLHRLLALSRRDHHLLGDLRLLFFFGRRWLLLLGLGRFGLLWERGNGDRERGEEWDDSPENGVHDVYPLFRSGGNANRRFL
jgi:hypothetical protein